MPWRAFTLDNAFRTLVLLASTATTLLASMMLYGSGFSDFPFRVRDWSVALANLGNAALGAGLVYWCAKAEFDLWPRVPIIVFAIMLPAWATYQVGWSQVQFGHYSAPFLLACLGLAAPWIYQAIDENED